MAIELKKGSNGITLEKRSDNDLGRIVVNLNWNTAAPEDSENAEKIDLDLGCFYKLKSGKTGVIQALGKHFGDFNNSPYIQLDKDDRSGESLDGENLFINGGKLSEISKILIYTYIYEGVTNWASTDGVVTIKPNSGEKIIIRMDEHDNSKKLCALALIENVNNNTFKIDRIIRYFKRQSELDAAYNWGGMNWKPGRKEDN